MKVAYLLLCLFLLGCSVHKDKPTTEFITLLSNITETYRMKNGTKTEISTENNIFNFRKFSPKPDSTNSFIK
jgi:hypothetical protein